MPATFVCSGERHLAPDWTALSPQEQTELSKRLKLMSPPASRARLRCNQVKIGRGLGWQRLVQVGLRVDSIARLAGPRRRNTRAVVCSRPS